MAVQPKTRRFDFPPEFVSTLEPSKSGPRMFAVLGEGAQGVVLEATWVVKGKKGPVAIKVFDISEGRFGNDPNNQNENRFYNSLLREATHAEYMKHRQICSFLRHFFVYDGEKATHYAMVFEKMDASLGACLQEQRESFRSLEWVRTMLVSLLRAVDHLHSSGVFHRDIKPDNIGVNFATGQLSVKLFDLGCSRRHGIEDEPMTAYAGTAVYMAPEFIVHGTSGKDYDFKVDIWSIGLVVLQILGYTRQIEGKERVATWPDPRDPLMTRDFNGVLKQIQKDFGSSDRTGLIRNKIRNLGEDWSDPHKSQLAILLSKMMAMDRNERWGAKECLDHEFLRETNDTMKIDRPQPPSRKSFMESVKQSPRLIKRPSDSQRNPRRPN